MKPIILFTVLVMSFLSIAANDYVEAYNVVSYNHSDSVNDIQIIRQINGGTVIIPEFDETCIAEMKGPFSYACKIVEEYMPPCMPLRIKVSCEHINSSVSGALSKVRSLQKENFGRSPDYNNATMSTIKGVILGELCHNSTDTYLDSINSVDFLNGVSGHRNHI